MKTLIVGGTGFVGKAILHGWQNYSSIRDELGDITVVSRNKPVDNVIFKSCIAAQWNLADEKSCPLEPYFDQIIHAASPTSRENIDPNIDFWETVNATKAVINFVGEHPHKPRLLYLSSGAAYGYLDSKLGPVTETSSLSCDTLESAESYGNAKRTSEYLVTLANHQEVCTGIVARLFAFSGRFLPLERHYAVGNFVQDAILGNDIKINGDGLAIRSYLDSNDLAIWISRIISCGKANQMHHIGSEIGISIAELAEKVCIRAQSRLGKSLSVKIEGDSQSRPSYYVPSTLRTRTSLNLQQTVSLDDSIDSMFA